MYECSNHFRRGIFDYSTGLADMILFLIGSMYIVAGSYPVAGEENLKVMEVGGVSKSPESDSVKR